MKTRRSILSWLPRLGAMGALMATASICSASAQPAASQRALAGAGSVFNPAGFSTVINNPYLPLKRGTTSIYQGTKGGIPQSVYVLVTPRTKTILGVTTVVVSDTVYISGTLEEATYDWYAQDAAGNVWYFGEDTTQFANGLPTGHVGSWQAGVQGALPGIVMLAHPQVGQTYRQEYLPGVAEDMAKVTALHTSVCVPITCYQGTVLQTVEFTPLEPGAYEFKSYAPGVGLVWVNAPDEQLKLLLMI